MSEKEETGRKIFEILIIVLGIGLLALTFSTAYKMFTNPSTMEGFDELTPEGKIEITMGQQNGGENTMDVSSTIKPILKITSYMIGGLLLWVMGSVGGRITKHGVSMYRS